MAPLKSPLVGPAFSITVFVGIYSVSYGVAGQGGLWICMLWINNSVNKDQHSSFIK